MASAPHAIRVHAADKYHSEKQAITQWFSATVFKKDATTWCQWRHFCSCLKITPNLKEIENPIPFLNFFFERVRASILSAQGQPIKKRSVEKYLCSIGKIFASVVANKPHHNHIEKLEFRMSHQLKS